MKAGMNTILTRLVQWVAIPLGLATFGFYVLGPRFGAHAPLALKKIAQEKLSPAPSPANAPAPKQQPISPSVDPAVANLSTTNAVPTADSSAGPDVEVTTDPGPAVAATKHVALRRRRHHIARTRVKKDPTTTTDTPPDSGSYLGTDEGQSTPATHSNPSAGGDSQPTTSNPSQGSSNNAPHHQDDGGSDPHETNGALDGGIIEHLNPQ